MCPVLFFAPFSINRDHRSHVHVACGGGDQDTKFSLKNSWNPQKVRWVNISKAKMSQCGVLKVVVGGGPSQKSQNHSLYSLGPAISTWSLRLMLAVRYGSPYPPRYMQGPLIRPFLSTFKSSFEDLKALKKRLANRIIYSFWLFATFNPTLPLPGQERGPKCRPLFLDLCGLLLQQGCPLRRGSHQGSSQGFQDDLRDEIQTSFGKS